jgi:hypothetical protein
MVDAAKLIFRYLPNVRMYFTHWNTTAVAEGMNSKIANVRKRACSFRNPEYYKTALCFLCARLKVYPAAVTHTNVGLILIIDTGLRRKGIPGD